MKKLLLIAVMAIFTTGAFAASSIRTTKSITKSGYKKQTTTKKQVQHCFDFNTCSQKASFSMDCGGRSVVFAVVTLSYDCESGRVINSDVWQSGNSCSSQE